MHSHVASRRVALAISSLMAVWATTGSSACNTTCVVDDTHAPALTATIQVPDHALDAFDVSWLDPITQRYYLADRANAGVEVVDAASGEYLRRVSGFAGNSDHDHSGPNGVLVASKDQKLWAGDGDSTVKIIDLASDAVEVVSTGGTARADELSYDPADGVVLVVNNAEEITEDAGSGSFATLISTDPGHAIIGKLVFHDATAGLEQSVWDPSSGHFLLAIPELGGEAQRGAIAVIDPRTAKLLNMYPVQECQPAGLALGPEHQLLVGCSGDAIEAGFASKSVLVDTRDGHELASIPQVGGSDEVWFNPGDRHYYLAARDNPDGAVLGVIDATTKRWSTNVPTGPDSKSVAVDPLENRVFVALTPTDAAFANDSAKGLSCRNGCIGVFTNPTACEPPSARGLDALSKDHTSRR